MVSAVVCAYSSVGTEALLGLLNAGVEILALYTYSQQPDEMWFLPPAVVAKQHNIPIFTETKFNTDEVFANISRLKPDFLFSFYFREMIQERFLKIPRLGAYNLHGSYLPKYRGRAPINWVLVHGETATGMTLHAMTPKPDDGDIVGRVEIPITWDETALSLTIKSAQVGRRLVQQAIPKLVDGSVIRVSQKTLGSSTYFGGRKPQDGELNFTWSVAQAFNLIRAVADPWPNAFIKTTVGEIKIAWALPSTSYCPAGHFLFTREGVLLGFADGALRLHSLSYQNQRSERPSDHVAWLETIGIPNTPQEY